MALENLSNDPSVETVASSVVNLVRSSEEDSQPYNIYIGPSDLGRLGSS